MNKENQLDNLSLKVEKLDISSKGRRVTRSASRLQTSTKEIPKINIKDDIVLPKKVVHNKNGDEKILKSKDVIESKSSAYESECIVGRESEKSEITNFLINCFKSGINSNLYISGSPGTGKTAVVTSVLEMLQTQNKCRFIMTTCMDFSLATGVYPDIWKKISDKEETNSSDAVSKIEKYLQTREKKDKPLVIVLDEVDQLTSTKQKILYRIFKWVELANCRLIIIGIANTLDLTESKLQDMILESYRPHHINFPPYTHSELEAIIMSRVKVELTPGERLGVTLCSKKVSSKSGDARVALDLYKRATTISEGDQLSMLKAESETKELKDDKVFRSPTKAVLSTPQLMSMRRTQFLTPSSPSIKHVNRAITEVEKVSNPYKHIVNADTGESSLPLHHKLVLCAALVLSKQKKSKATLGQLFSMYESVCTSQAITALDTSDLVNICDLLDTRSLMKVRTHKEVRQRTFTLNLDEAGIESALADNALLTSILVRFCPS